VTRTLIDVNVNDRGRIENPSGCFLNKGDLSNACESKRANDPSFGIIDGRLNAANFVMTVDEA
jgi:hypothetical protein